MGGCNMGGPLSVTFSDNFTDIFYRMFVDDIYGRKKIGGNVLFKWLNNYHPSVEL